MSGRCTRVFLLDLPIHAPEHPSGATAKDKVKLINTQSHSSRRPGPQSGADLGQHGVSASHFGV
jgi:hypothetical protein